MKNIRKILVLGLGSEILQDESVGLRIVADLKSAHFSTDIRFESYRFLDLEMLHIISGYDILILVDGIVTGKNETGSVFSLTPHDEWKTVHLVNYHDVELEELLKLGSLLGTPVPDIVKVIAIELASLDTFGENLSPELSEMYPRILGKVKILIHQIITPNQVVSVSDFRRFIHEAV